MKLTTPNYINESASTPYLGGIGYEMAATAPAPEPVIVQTPPPISPGEVEITVKMQVAYSIEKMPKVAAPLVKPERIEPEER